MALIEVTDLYKHFGDVKAVDGISFSVDEGAIFGFLGPNGAGKTTTIRILVALSKQTSGTAVVAGIDVAEDPNAVRSRIGYAAQATGIDRDLTGRENVILQGRLHGMSKSDAETEADEILEITSLSDVAERRAGTYSGGMARRLDLGQALIHRPSVLFLDEPTTGLDPQNRNALWAYLHQLNADGMTMLLTTQYLEEADELVDTLAIIDEGKIVVEGSPAQLKRDIGGDSIVLTLRDDSTADELQRVESAMRSMGNTTAVEVLDGTVAVYVEDGGSRLAEVVRSVDALGIHLGRLELAEPSLDQVFLKHTGARLRVEEVKPQSPHVAEPEAHMSPVTETLTIAQRNLRKSVRVPMLLFMSLFQPLLFLVLFSQIFVSLADLPGFPYDSYLQFLVPAIIAMTALSSAFQSGLGTVADVEDGMLDKFLIAPIHRVSIMAGRILSDGTRIIAQAAVVIFAAFLMGARYETGILGILMMIFLASIFGMAWAGLSNIVALRTQNAELTMVIGIVLLFPILFLSTGFMPSALLPDWLDTVSQLNPLSYLINAERALVNDGWDWSLILQSIAVTVVLGAVTLTGATRAFRKAIS